MENNTLYNTILDTINDMRTSDAIALFNEYNEADSRYDFIYSMYDLDDLLTGRKPSEVLNSVTSDFSTNDDYFYDTIYGLDSFTYIEDCSAFYAEDIATYICDNMEDLNSQEIADILEEYENNENDFIIHIYLNDNNGVYSQHYCKFETDMETATDIKNAFINNDLNALKEILYNTNNLPYYDDVKTTEYLTLEIDDDNYNEVIQGK